MLARCGAWIRAKRHAARTAESGLADPETGLYNLRGLLRRARELAGAARRGEGNPVLACVALHAGGVGAPSAAALVRQVSAACGGVGRVTDVFARTGTREFAILAPATSAAGAERLLERLRGALGGVAVDAVVRTADCGSGDPGEAVELVIRTLEALAARG
jgi:GGDEF domain-containing protein